jgi:lysyl-tRNA synthetase class 2
MTLTPSQLAPDTRGSVTLAGRVVAFAAGRLVVGDALATVEVELLGPPRVDAGNPVGELWTLEGEARDGRLVRARLVERHGGGAHLDETSRLERIGRHLALRAAVQRTVRGFFDEGGYLEVDTPVRVPSPGLDLHLDAFALAQEGEPMYLGTSPEYQMKRLVAGGLPRIFQIARCFRAGESGARHNPEFVMLEWYRAHADYHALMDETEDLVRLVLERHGAAGALDAARFERLRLAEAFERFAGLGEAPFLDLATRDEERYFRVLIERVEPGLASEGRPVFLHDYPSTQASLARLKPADPRYCERFELYLGDLELCNGFGELTDPGEQRRRLERDQAERRRRGKPVYPIDERFLAALEEGMPPTAGNALGLDRLVAVCAGTPAIADVMPFPSAWL